MSTPANFTSLLARLLSDSALRREFARDSILVAKKLTSDPALQQTIVGLDLECLNRQALTLLRKRWFEISQVLPVTCAELGKQGWPLFVEYAEKHWPEGHLRHVDDALKFGQFLEKRNAPELNGLEWKRFWFSRSGHLIQISRVRQRLASGKEKKFWHCLWRNSTTGYRELRFGW